MNPQNSERQSHETTGLRIKCTDHVGNCIIRAYRCEISIVEKNNKKNHQSDFGGISCRGILNHFILERIVKNKHNKKHGHREESRQYRYLILLHTYGERLTIHKRLRYVTNLWRVHWSNQRKYRQGLVLPTYLTNSVHEYINI